MTGLCSLRKAGCCLPCSVAAASSCVESNRRLLPCSLGSRVSFKKLIFVFPCRNGSYICVFLPSPESRGHRDNTSVPLPYLGKRCV